MESELYTGSGTPVRLKETIGDGGEAFVFDTSRSGLCAKFYGDDNGLVERVDEWKRRKLQLMVQDPPDDPAEEKNHTFFAWPEEVLYREPSGRRCVGFLMPLINTDRFRGLHTFKTPSSRRNKFRGFSWLNLFSVAHNLSIAVYNIHEKGYCVGDINEENILVDYGRTLVTIIDCDSFQVHDPDTGNVLPCPVGKPEYTAPELSDQAERYKDIERTPESDAFALGILLFELLMENTSPYQGIGPALEDAPSAPAKLKKGLFPYLSKNRGANPPPSAPPFEILHPRLRDLFVRCFDKGHGRPNQRPSAREWVGVFGSLRDNFQQCQKNENHRFLDHLKECPWCNWSPPGVADCFPSPNRQRNSSHAGGLNKKKRGKNTTSKGTANVGASKRGGQSVNTSTNWPMVIIGIIALGLLGNILLSESNPPNNDDTSSNSGGSDSVPAAVYVDRATDILQVGESEEAVIILKKMSSEYSDEEVVRALSGAREDLNVVTDKWAPIHIVARGGSDTDIELLRQLLKAGVNPDVEADWFGNRPLHLAAADGDVEAVRLLLRAGADPNVKKEDGNIEITGSPEANDGDTPLQMAAEEGHARVVRMLLQVGATERKSALIDAVNTNVGSDGNHEDVARALLAAGVNPNEPGDDHGIVPLNTAAYRGNPEMVRILLKEGANPNLEDGDGETALESTRYGKKDQVKRILREAMNR